MAVTQIFTQDGIEQERIKLKCASGCELTLHHDGTGDADSWVDKTVWIGCDHFQVYIVGGGRDTTNCDHFTVR